MGFLRQARVFNERGRLGDGATDLVYYDHRRSRGSDAALASNAAGLFIVDWDTTPKTDAAQSMYRLRGIDYLLQTVQFVVCGVDVPDTVTGEMLLAKLTQNEMQRVARVGVRGALQSARASTKKTSIDASVNDPFSVDIPYGDAILEDLGSVDNTQEQEQQQQQQQEQYQIKKDDCIHIDFDLDTVQTLDPLVQYTAKDYKTMSLSASKLAEPLRASKMHISPLLLYFDPATRNCRTAFVVTPSCIMLCALIEVWAKRLSPTDSRLLHRQIQREQLAAFSREGLFLHGNEEAAGVTAGAKLFGRYLCGDSLSQIDQLALLAHLEVTYTDRAARDSLLTVLSCLVNTGIVPPHAGMLRCLSERSDWAENRPDEGSDEYRFVDEVMRPATRFGRRRFV
jgi:hypothetical protein